MKSKTFRFLLSLVIALGIWLYVVTVVSPESEATIQGIPVLLEGESVLAERGLIIVSNKDFTVDLKLFGNRLDLKKLSASNITVSADLSQITEPGEHNIRYVISYPSVVQPGNVEPLERDPQYITLTIAERDWKDVPVKIRYIGSVPTNYVADRQNSQLDHATVTVSGPKDYVKSVNHASISVDLGGKVETIVGNFRPVLCTADGMTIADDIAAKLTMNVNEIRATIRIYRIKQIPLEVNVIPGGGLTEKDVKVTLKQETIVVSGSDEDLENLDSIVVGQIDLKSLLESTELKFAIIMPPGVSNVTGVTELAVNVELLVQLEIRTFTVTQIRLENVPGNRHVELVTQEFHVRIRGTAEALDNLKPEDIVAVVDCGDVEDMANMTTAPLNATIQILTDSGAGAIDDCQVWVEVTEENAETAGG